MPRGDARRKILFYRAVPDEGTGAVWDPSSVYSGIAALVGTDAYLEESGRPRRSLGGPESSGFAFIQGAAG
jgi:hypothetical protein